MLSRRRDQALGS